MNLLYAAKASDGTAERFLKEYLCSKGRTHRPIAEFPADTLKYTSYVRLLNDINSASTSSKQSPKYISAAYLQIPPHVITRNAEIVNELLAFFTQLGKIFWAA